MAGGFPVAAAAVALALVADLCTTGAPASAGDRKHSDTEVNLALAMFGRSGSLSTRVAMPGSPLELVLDWSSATPADVWYRWIPDFGTTVETAVAPFVGGVVHAPSEPGIFRLEIGWAGATREFDELRLVVPVPFQVAARGSLEGYRIGRYPAGRTGRYAPPSGFIRVTPENARLRLSRHFTLNEFLTHDQSDVWPKFAVVDPLLLDKLELVFDELNARGIRAQRMVVMSGFRTPQYNRQGLTQGRARLSRHQYGDAADVWVDNDADWYMDDLNGDGRRDTRDARVLLAAVARVEERHPDLVGGAGVYADNGVHGPFLHVDVRGVAARW